MRNEDEIQSRRDAASHRCLRTASTENISFDANNCTGGRRGGGGDDDDRIRENTSQVDAPKEKIKHFKDR